MAGNADRKQKLVDTIELHTSQLPDGSLTCSLESCEFKTPSKDAFKLHVLKFHVDDELKIFSCSHCDEKFVLKSFLSDHVRWSHNYEPPPKVLVKKRKVAEYDTSDELFAQFANSPWWDLLVARATKRDNTPFFINASMSPLEIILQEMGHALKELETLLKEILEPAGANDEDVIKIPRQIASAFRWQNLSWSPKNRGSDHELLLLEPAPKDPARREAHDGNEDIETIVESVVNNSEDIMDTVSHSDSESSAVREKGGNNWTVTCTKLESEGEEDHGGSETEVNINETDETHYIAEEDKEENGDQVEVIDRNREIQEKMRPYMKDLPNGKIACKGPSCKLKAGSLDYFREHYLLKHAEDYFKIYNCDVPRSSPWSLFLPITFGRCTECNLQG